jgi:hypothetical protein
MISTLKYIAPKIKNLTVGGFVSGFLVGCFPNKLFINFDGKEYKSFEIPLISGVIGSTGIILSPLLLINYFCNGTYFDR